MHPYKRAQRVSGSLREDIAQVVLTKIKDPRLGFVTITDVSVSDDLKSARVFVSILKKEYVEQSLKVLNSAAGFIRKEIAKTLSMKVIPVLSFFEDKSMLYGSKIDKIFEKIHGDSHESTRESD
ncbi:30S ribosome-binding factor RbfA [Candidatus Magnetomonas plexicatena]|uniref:30S ribosome-binding factor RbfA n=1 Tax=Candidatus Magnetomonas plexicatena TaxID=2552947 RepID=UPI0011019013|nr:30S ribosome-binding factor RbfA [Nitrospirales bacterium LBB_01]